MKIWLAAIMVSVLFLGVIPPCHAGGWLIYHDGPYIGQVLDDETGEPIEGVAVVGVWDLDLYGGPAGPIEHGFDDQESVTDKEGRFKLSSRTGFYWWPFAGMKKPYFYAYKPGYDSYPPVLPFIGASCTAEEREKAMIYRKKHWIDFSRKSLNVIRLKKTVNDEERIHVMSSQFLPISGSVRNIKNFTKYRLSEHEKLIQKK